MAPIIASVVSIHTGSVTSSTSHAAMASWSARASATVPPRSVESPASSAASASSSAPTSRSARPRMVRESSAAAPAEPPAAPRSRRAPPRRASAGRCSSCRRPATAPRRARASRAMRPLDRVGSPRRGGPLASTNGGPGRLVAGHRPGRTLATARHRARARSPPRARPAQRIGRLRPRPHQLVGLRAPRPDPGRPGRAADDASAGHDDGGTATRVPIMGRWTAASLRAPPEGRAPPAP